MMMISDDALETCLTSLMSSRLYALQEKRKRNAKISLARVRYDSLPIASIVVVIISFSTFSKKTISSDKNNANGNGRRERERNEWKT